MSSPVSKSFLLPGNVLRCMKMHTKCCQDISESQDTRSLLIGLFTTAFAGLCFTSGNTMVKLLPPGSSYDILLLRSLIQVHIIYEYFMDILLDDSFTTTLILQMQLMLPLVIRADSGFYGSEDWSTRLDCVFWRQGHVWLPCSGGGWWLREQWGASFFCLWCRQSRGENIALHIFRYVPLFHLFH